MAPRTLTWLVLFGFLFALFLRVMGFGQNTDALTLQREQNTYQELRRIISDRYVDPVQQKKLFYGALKGMAGSLDRHTVFWSPQQFELERSATSGHFAGVGIEISWDEQNGLRVVTPLMDTPAYDAGLMPGDRIIKIEDRSAERMDLEEASKLIRGAPGTEVRLTIAREGLSDPLEIPVKRAIIKIKSIQEAGFLKAPQSLTARIPAGAPKIAYIRIVTFQEETAADLEKALEELEAQGLQALILDLRQNPGGLLTSAIKVCDLFLSDGPIVSTKGRAPSGEPSPEETFSAHKSGTRPTYPMVVMIDKHSASASEIVSGCLKDRKRATLVGEKSYGKGSVQTIIPLNLGELGDAALKLTTAKYYTPSGVTIDGEGVKPHYALPFTNDQMRSFLIGRRERRLKRNDPRRVNGNSETDKAEESEGAALPKNGSGPHAFDPKDDKENTPKTDEASKPAPFFDFQLEKSVEVLIEQLDKGTGKP